MKTVGIFARHPVAGTTKTRLAASIGHDQATQLYASFVRDLMNRFAARTGRDAEDRLLVAATPADAAAEHWFRREVPSGCDLRFQPDGDLGDRIDWFFQSTLIAEGDLAVLIGSDSPDLPDSIVDAAFSALATHDAVIAPACDGGFVLVGLRKLPSGLFDGVSWSTPTTLQEVLSAAADAGMITKLLPLWYDVDTLENLGTLAAFCHDGDAAQLCPLTAETLDRCMLWD